MNYWGYDKMAQTVIEGDMSHVKSKWLRIPITYGPYDMDQFGSHLNRVWINLDHRFTNSKLPILLNDSEKLNDISQIKMYKLRLSS